MNILITSYYELRESLLYASEALERKGFNVISYPLYEKYTDINNKIENYDDDMIEFIKDNNINAILWWYINIPYKNFEKIVTHQKYSNNIKNYFFNWDDPHNWDNCELEQKAKHFETVFACSKEKLKDYIENGAKNAILTYPGYDNSVHNMIIEDEHIAEYNCDISICCTNLYESYPNQIINRKLFIDQIYHNQDKYNYTFHIYGPKKFRDMYPDSYKGFIDYHDTCKLFNASKINICTHVQDADSYLNERAILIQGSGGLLYIDPITNIDNIMKDNHNCIYIDKDNYIQQIVNILENYDDCYIIRYNGNQTSQHYTWDNWASIIEKNILE